MSFRYSRTNASCLGVIDFDPLQIDHHTTTAKRRDAMQNSPQKSINILILLQKSQHVAVTSSNVVKVATRRRERRAPIELQLPAGILLAGFMAENIYSLCNYFL